MSILALLFGLLCAPAPAPAQDDMEVPVARQVSLLTRVLAFDRGLAGDGPLVIGVVYQERHRASRRTADEVEAAFGTATTIHGRLVRVAFVPLSSPSRLGNALRAAGAEVAYLAPLRGADIGAVAVGAASAGAVTVTGVRRYVSEGVAVGIGLRDGRPEILLHRRAANTCGADFSARLLQIATLVE